MAPRKLTVVISQAPGKNPTKRHLEEEIATRLMLTGSADVSLIPHLNDLAADHHGFLWLRKTTGPLVVLGWLFPRAIRWILDRNGVRGLEGITQLPVDEENADDESNTAEPPTGIGSLNVPNRPIYVIDLRSQADPEIFVAEIERISKNAVTPLFSLGSSSSDSLLWNAGPTTSPIANGTTAEGKLPAATSAPVPFSFFGMNGAGNSGTNGHVSNGATETVSEQNGALGPVDLTAGEVKRRWYPVIDYSRCTNCMECIDFCLFGVYGVDQLDRILVEEQDNCKKGCPACSRVCPANAIIFPEHKTDAIAGAPSNDAGDFKIDLSKLFGAPSAIELAALERDRELVADGRDAVGLTVGIPKRQPASGTEQPRDELDDLMDGLDDF